MTLKTKRLVKSDFDEFIKLYCAEDRSKRSDIYNPHLSPLPGGEGVKKEGPRHQGDDSKDGGGKATHEAKAGGLGKGESRWRSFTYEELIARDKTNLDIFWLKDDSLEDTENLPAPEILAQEIVEQLQAALDEFRLVEEILAVNDD